MMLRWLTTGLVCIAGLLAGCRTSAPPTRSVDAADALPESVPAPFAPSSAGEIAAAFRLTPYLQRPEQTSMTVVWFSHAATPGKLLVFGPYSEAQKFTSSPTLAAELTWLADEPGPALPPPYRHVVRVTGLHPGTRYAYVVQQSGATTRAHFRTAPDASQAFRVVVFADSETEPESTGSHVDWPAPDGTKRTYPLDQTDGFAANLRAVAAAEPDLLLIAGDLVETGGEQRDWEEFWRHLAPLAATVPIVPALGNHDYYGGPHGDGYRGHAAAVARYLCYFQPPPNGAANPAHEGRYYRLDYGPATFLVLDTNNGDDASPEADTNHYLTTPDAPSFLPGSAQATWLETELTSAEQPWRFAMLHHTPWSAGVHGQKPGVDKLSSVPVQSLAGLFMRHRLTALFAGHDEMYEHSVIRQDSHHVHVYDVGIAGDGLRGPHTSVDNPAQTFLAHTDSPEIWKKGEIVSGGKHYGFLLVEIHPDRVVLSPRYVLPSGRVMTYPDIVEIKR